MTTCQGLKCGDPWREWAELLTGRPKGAQVSRANLVWQTHSVSEIDTVTGPGVKVLNVLPLFHSGGFNALATPAFIAGGCVGVLKRFDADVMVELLDDPSRGYTHCVLVPLMFSLMERSHGFAGGAVRDRAASLVGWRSDVARAARRVRCKR